MLEEGRGREGGAGLFLGSGEEVLLVGGCGDGNGKGLKRDQWRSEENNLKARLCIEPLVSYA